MNKRGWEIAKLAQLIIVVIALIIIFNFVKGKMAYGSGIFSNLFGKVNESIGGVSWSDLTKAQRDIMNDKQKAESMFYEIEKELNKGIGKRKNKLFDEAKTSFEKALGLVNQILNLKETNSAQKIKAEGLKTTLQYYLRDLGEYENVAEYLEEMKKAKVDDVQKILEECEAKYPRSVRSVDCIVRAYLLKANLMDKKSDVAIRELAAWLNQQINSAKGDSSKIARLNLAAGEILYELSSVLNADSKPLLEEAIKYYNIVTSDTKNKEFYDYVGRAHYRMASIYKNSYEALGIRSSESFTKSTAEYAELFKKLGGRDFVDKQEAIQEQKIVSSRCFQAVAFKDREGQQTISSIGIFSPAEIHFRVVSLDAGRCSVSGLWQYQVFLKKGDTSNEILNAAPSQTSNPGVYLLNHASLIRGKPLRDYEELLFVAYKVENEKNRVTLELPIKQ